MILSILFYPNTQKANHKTGKIPMYVRVILNREKAEMRLNIDVFPRELKKWDDRIMRFSDSAKNFINVSVKNIGSNKLSVVNNIIIFGNGIQFGSGFDEITIRDVLGKIQKHEVFTTGTQTATIDISNLIDGMYFIEIINGSNKQTQKLVIQK
jgi:hypothetical protein